MDAAIQFNDKPGTIAIKISHIIKTFLAGYIISTLSTNLASAPPLPILGRGRGGYNFDTNGRGGYNFDISCISSDWQDWYTNTDNHLMLNYIFVFRQFLSTFTT
jgi:hypothetical protein